MDLVYLGGGIGAGILLFVVVGGWLYIRLNKQKNTDPKKPLQQAAQGFSDSRLGSESVLNALDDGVIMVDARGVIRYINPAAAHISGWEVNEAVGLAFHSVIVLLDSHGSRYELQNHPFSRALKQSRAVKDNDAVLSTKNGKQIAVSIIVSPVMEAQGGPATAVVGVMRDISAEREEEKQRSEFISTASHEMRTPIAAIEGYLALALNPKVSTVDERAKKYLQKAHSSTQHLAELFQDLLTSSKAEDGRIASYPTAVELGEALEQIADGARFHARQKGLELYFMAGTSKEVAGARVIRPPYYIYADPNRIREVLQNIVDNAVKYTARGSITIFITGNDSTVQVRVIDTGQGIPEEDIPHLFQKFYRVDSSMTRSIGGTGLGLFISKKIIEMYNGRIWVESELGKGSIFYVNLPRLSSEQAAHLQTLNAAQQNNPQTAVKN